MKLVAILLRKNGNVRNQKNYVKLVSTPQLQSTTKYQKFTLLSFASATGESVICIINFQEERGKLPINYTTIIYITVDPIVGKDGKIVLDESNFGERGKYLP